MFTLKCIDSINIDYIATQETTISRKYPLKFMNFA